MAASASAIAFTYSWPIALLLGALLPVALGGGVLGIYLLTAGLSVLALLEGALLIEMIRAATQQTGSASTGRWGAIATLVRAGLLVVLLLAVYLLLNPTYALAILHSVPAVESLSYAIPLFWSTQAIGQWVAGHAAYTIAFALGQLAFVGLLLYLAGVLRDRYWVPSPTDATAVGSAPSSGHRFLRALGLSGAGGGHRVEGPEGVRPSVGSSFRPSSSRPCSSSSCSSKGARSAVSVRCSGPDRSPASSPSCRPPARSGRNGIRSSGCTPTRSRSAASFARSSPRSSFPR